MRLPNAKHCQQYPDVNPMSSGVTSQPVWTPEAECARMCLMQMRALQQEVKMEPLDTGVSRVQSQFQFRVSICSNLNKGMVGNHM